jgi:hypothetical protein
MVKLSNGREIEVDLYKVTRKEWREFVDPKGTLEAEDIFISKVSGLPVDEVASLPEPDFRKLVTEVITARRASPN